MLPEHERREPTWRGLVLIFEVARGVDQYTMSLQYLETLKDVGASPAG